MRQRNNERGVALIGAVLIMMILSMLGMVSLNVAAQEIESIAAAREEAVARHLAEAGADMVKQWFHDPDSAPGGPALALFTMRHEGSDGSPSFFDPAGRSQFTGTEANPDILYDSTRPTDDLLLNGASGGRFRDMEGVGRLRRLAVYGPTSPGQLCTVKVTATANRLTRTLVVQLGTRPLPPIRAGMQIGTNGPVPAAPGPLPVSVHWGDVVANGDANLGPVRNIPRKFDLASLAGQAYAEMAVREDRWFDLLVGGEASFAAVVGEQDSMPANVQIRQEPSPGLPLDHWDYQALKDTALRHGTYYARGQDGLLYRHGQIEPGRGVTVTDAVRSGAVGDHRGLVFVDTLDQAPPRPDNLGTLVLDADYMEGIFVINADIRFVSTGIGKTLLARSPLLQWQETTQAGDPVQLTGITLHGALVTPGNLMLEGASRVHGAVVAGGRVETASETGAHLEVWYNAEFQRGLFRGVPLVYVGMGTWPENR